MSYTTAPNLGMPIQPSLETHYPGPGSLGTGSQPGTPRVLILTPDFRQIDLVAALQYLGISASALSTLQSQVADLESRVTELEA